tara:strand:+ start:180 stop:974 length:795 start_codon:yes stop_codon:yes gene_type:complete
MAMALAFKQPCPPLGPIKAKARAHSQQLIDDRNTTKYDVHGLFGIFGKGDLAAGTGRRYFKNYGDVKVDFMHAHACRLGRNLRAPTVCEVGFNAGLSALLLLESMPHARVLSFDLGDFPWARPADAMLRKQYGTARFPGVVFGDAVKRVPEHAAEHAFRCDLVFVDGDKSYEGRFGTLAVLRRVSSNHAAVFMDEVTTEACVNGTYVPASPKHARQCAAMEPDYWPSVRAYTRACHEGWLRVQRCAWPLRHPHDGICLGKFTNH